MKCYMNDYFLKNLLNRLESCKNEASHCCGLCMKWDEYEDWPAYGDCKLGIGEGLGFDCLIGKACVMFEPAFEIEVGLNVHDKRFQQPIKVVE